jgi:hypothetical protein
MHKVRPAFGLYSPGPNDPNKTSVTTFAWTYQYFINQELIGTVGAQSIAPAQSIVHGQIGDSFSKKK